MILDVGCGENPRGEVNVDIYLNEIHPNTGRFIDAKIPNPVKADAHHLPFRENAFALVYSRSMLEHIENPTKALLEMIRVASDEVFFIVPHRFFRRSLFRGQPKVHIHFFSTLETKKWVKKLIGCDPIIRIVWQGIPNNVVSLVRLPWIIEVKIKKPSWKHNGSCTKS